MAVKKWYPRLTILPTLFCLALLPAAAFAAPDSMTIFDCEQKAATFTRKMGKPGNMYLYKQHFEECIDASVPSSGMPTLKAKTRPAKAKLKAKAETCTATDSTIGHLITFKNTTTETIWLGVYDKAAANHNVSPPDDWPNWELKAGAQNSWCAPKNFNGRFMTRARCETKDGFDKDGKPIQILTGVCAEGNCCNPASTDPNDCTAMRCNIGNEAASLAEFTFDDHPTTWLDVSYVDGYNFPVMIESNDPNCDTLGQAPKQECDPPPDPQTDPPTTPKCHNVVGQLPDCPWKTIDGVCLGPFKQYALNNPLYKYDQNYYTVAAMCAAWDVGICGCGDQCRDKDGKVLNNPCPTTYTTPTNSPATGRQVTLQSSGCSPFNTNYRGIKNPETGNWTVKQDLEALKQVVCDPLGARASGDDDPKMNPCQHEWPEKDENGVDYRAYVKAINGVIKKAYTWQYHDNDSLTQCPTTDVQSFTVTIGPRPANGNGNAYALKFNPAGDVKGAIKAAGQKDAPFAGGNPLSLALQHGDKVTIETSCPDKLPSLSCTATYDKDKGLTSDDAPGSVCRDKGKSGINWGDKQNVAISNPNGLGCWPMTVFMPDNFHATVSVGGNQLPDIGARNAKQQAERGLNLKPDDKVVLVVDCMDDKQTFYDGTVTCNLKYNGDKGILELDTDAGSTSCNQDAVAASLGLKRDPATTQHALSPSIPRTSFCQ